MHTEIVFHDFLDGFQAVAGDRGDLVVIAAGKGQPGNGRVAQILVAEVLQAWCRRDHRLAGRNALGGRDLTMLRLMLAR